jgi:hypothetical protein
MPSTAAVMPTSSDVTKSIRVLDDSRDLPA